jgi:hypothetical protein
MNSILSYPQRGNHGSNGYRGNTSGIIIKDLITHFKPTSFLDVCMGSGTSKDVCMELGVPFYGLDIHTGFDFTQHSALHAIGGKSIDMAFSHPPYWSMVDYHLERARHHLTSPSGLRDLSGVSSAEEFLEWCQVMLYNQREASKAGGHYVTLIGDMRKQGKFYNFQSDLVKMMPRDELISVSIKLQHNTLSGYKKYKSSDIVPIQHEYLIIWRKGTSTLASIAWNRGIELKQSIDTTRRNFVRIGLMNLGGKATLQQIYNKVEEVAANKIRNNPNYKAKVRQVLQYHFTAISRGEWAM